MKLHPSYKQNPRITDTYDAIIIGSGIGGMSLAAFLSKAGQRVLVLEKHYTAGGFTHVFRRKDYEWDVGVHYIGEVHREGKMLNRMFHYISEGRLEWADMGEVYDKIVFGDKVYDFVKGKEGFIDQMKSYFPHQHRQIDDYIQAVYEVQRSAKPFFVEKAMGPGLGWMMSPILRRKMLKYSDRTTLSVLQEMGCSKELIAVLTGQFGDYGLPPGQSSFAIHAMVVKHYLYGACYPIGGSSKIFESILPVIQRNGGEVYSLAEVEQILIQKNKAVGVRMADGQEILAPMVISSAGATTTFFHLLSEEDQAALELEKRMAKLEPSVAHICLYIGCKESSEALALPKANYWLYPDNYDHDANIAAYLKDPSSEIPLAYVSFPSAKDPDWENRYPGKSSIQVIGLAPYAWFAKWEDKGWKKRGGEYDQLKEALAERMLEKLYQQEPQLRGKVDFYELSSPLSTKHFCNYQQGEIYGLSHTPDRFKQRFIRTQTPIKGLYLTGQDVATAGVGGALYGGFLTATTILKKNMIKVIYEEAIESNGAQLGFPPP